MSRTGARWTSRSAVALSLAGITALGITANATFGATAFTAQAGGTGTYQSGTLLLSKSNNTGTCLSSANTGGSISTNSNLSCAGSDLSTSSLNAIGAVSNQTITLTNQGSLAAGSGLTLSTGACTVAGAPFASSALDSAASGSDTSGYCGNVWVTIQNNSGSVSCIYPARAGTCPAPSASYTLATLQSTNGISIASALASGTSDFINYTLELGTTATNADQGLTASMPITYTLTQ
jgi:hypothetical protein